MARISKRASRGGGGGGHGAGVLTGADDDAKSAVTCRDRSRVLVPERGGPLLIAGGGNDDSFLSPLPPSLLVFLLALAAAIADSAAATTAPPFPSMTSASSPSAAPGAEGEFGQRMNAPWGAATGLSEEEALRIRRRRNRRGPGRHFRRGGRYSGVPQTMDRVHRASIGRRRRVGANNGEGDVVDDDSWGSRGEWRRRREVRSDRCPCRMAARARRRVGREGTDRRGRRNDGSNGTSTTITRTRTRPPTVSSCTRIRCIHTLNMEEVEVSYSPYQEIMFYHDLRAGDTCLVLDNTLQMCTDHRPHYHEPFVHLPISYLSNDDGDGEGVMPRRVAIVGGGDSMLLHEVLKYPTVELVLALELDQEVVRRSFKHFATPPRFDDQRVQWYFGDAAKSINLVPRTYFGTFDLVLIDLAENVLSNTVTRELTVLGALAALLHPTRGIMVENEDYVMKYASIFRHTMRLNLNGLPMVCSQRWTVGSNSLEDALFLRGPNLDGMRTHSVDTVLYKPLDGPSGLDEHYAMITKYVRNDTATGSPVWSGAATTDGSSAEAGDGLCAADLSDYGEEDDDGGDGDDAAAGILLVMEVERSSRVNRRPPHLARAVASALRRRLPRSFFAAGDDDDGDMDFSVLSHPSHAPSPSSSDHHDGAAGTGKGSVVANNKRGGSAIVVFPGGGRGGYVTVHTWPTLGYAAVDAHLWGEGLKYLGEVRDAFLDATGGIRIAIAGDGDGGDSGAGRRRRRSQGGGGARSPGRTEKDGSRRRWSSFRMVTGGTKPRSRGGGSSGRKTKMRRRHCPDPRRAFGPPSGAVGTNASPGNCGKKRKKKGSGRDDQVAASASASGKEDGGEKSNGGGLTTLQFAMERVLRSFFAFTNGEGYGGNPRRPKPKPKPSPRKRPRNVVAVVLCGSRHGDESSSTSKPASSSCPRVCRMADVLRERGEAYLREVIVVWSDCHPSPPREGADDATPSAVDCDGDRRRRGDTGGATPVAVRHMSTCNGAGMGEDFVRALEKEIHGGDQNAANITTTVAIVVDPDAADEHAALQTAWEVCVAKRGHSQQGGGGRFLDGQPTVVLMSSPVVDGAPGNDKDTGPAMGVLSQCASHIDDDSMQRLEVGVTFLGGNRSKKSSGPKRAKIGAVSSGLPDVTRSIAEATASIEELTGMQMEAHVGLLQRHPHASWTTDAVGAVSDYDVLPGRQQFRDQHHLGNHSLFHFDISDFVLHARTELRGDGDGDNFSEEIAAQLRHAVGYAVMRSGVALLELEVYDEHIHGALVVAMVPGGHAVALWDGKVRVDFNLLTWDSHLDHDELSDFFMEKLSGIEALAWEEHPRGIGRVVNFAADVKSANSCHKDGFLR